jgi:hypothetical protein
MSSISSVTKSARLRRPWIDDINAAVLKVLHVARSEACSTRTSHLFIAVGLPSLRRISRTSSSCRAECASS